MNSLVGSLTWLNWVSLIGACMLFIGPGYALFSFYPQRTRFDRTQITAIAIGLAISFWSILLAWLYALRIALTPSAALAIFFLGWVIGLVRTKPWRVFSTGSGFRKIFLDWSRVALWGALALTVLTGLYAIREIVAGPGSDSYHHTLIAQMIIDRGILPDNMQPYAPTVTFTYHFGFHGVIAALGWLTGLDALHLVPIVAEILMAVAALAVGFFTEIATRNRLAATASVIVTGLISVFPAFYINWGRYTQLTGLGLLPIFLGLALCLVESDFDWKLTVLIGILAAGTALAHYRVTLMAALGVLVLIGIELPYRTKRLQLFKRIGVRLVLSGIVAALLWLPWAWHVFSSRQQGFVVNVGSTGPSFFSLDRLGPNVQSYPTNIVLLALAVIAIILGWWKRSNIAMALSLWTALMLVLSLPRFAGVFMDTISVVISLYFPAAVLIGWLFAVVNDRLPVSKGALRWALWSGLAIFTLRGIIALSGIIEQGSAYVTLDDLPAMEWIRDHTPPTARFMVNTYHWDFLPDFVIGSDAGYWLPLLAERSTVTMPMNYSFENATTPDLGKRLTALDRLNGHLTSPEAIALLQQEGITHVFVGKRSGPIVVSEMKSSAFELQYTNDSAFVFRFLGATK